MGATRSSFPFQAAARISTRQPRLVAASHVAHSQSESPLPLTHPTTRWRTEVNPRSPVALKRQFQDGAEVVRVGGAAVEQDGGAQPVGGRNHAGDGCGVVGEGGGQLCDVLPPSTRHRTQGGPAGGEGGEFTFCQRAFTSRAGCLCDEFGQAGELVPGRVDCLGDNLSRPASGLERYGAERVRAVGRNRAGAVSSNVSRIRSMTAATPGTRAASRAAISAVVRRPAAPG